MPTCCVQFSSSSAHFQNFVFVFRCQTERPSGKAHEIKAADLIVTDKHLGLGALGSVRLGYHHKRPVAVKSLLASVQRSLTHSTPEEINATIKVIEEEFELLAHLHFPTIVQVYGLFGRGTPSAAIVMELMEGSLSDRIETGPSLKNYEVCSIFFDVASALHYMHGLDVIHRDLSPWNILLSSSSDGNLIAKVSDYHNAKLAKVGETHQLSGKYTGTPKYMAPELHEPPPTEYNQSIDIYALGVILLETLSHPNLIRVMADARLDEIEKLATKIGGDHPYCLLVARCLVRDPQSRPSAAEVSSNLHELKEQPDFKAPLPPGEPVHRGIMTDC